MRSGTATAAAAGLATVLVACGGGTATLTPAAPPPEHAPVVVAPSVPLDVQPGQTVVLGHCGVQPLEHDGRQWDVQDPPFDATNAPAGFSGFGTLERDGDRLHYVDREGARLVFQPAETVVEGPCA